MGFNTVVVLFNDMTPEIRASGDVGARIATAMTCWNYHNYHTGNDGYFHAGRVISRAHADSYQITVVHANGGCMLKDANNLPPYILEQLAECLARHGWPARKRRVSP